MPQPGDYILWKQYGFRHIVRDQKKTYCGNLYDWRVRQYEGWAVADEGRGNHDGAKFWRDMIKYNQATEHRPTCGTCAKIHAKREK